MIKLKEKNVYKIFEDFFNATKIHCCIFDENYSALCYYREDRRTYCDIMKSKPITCAFCDKCDTNAFTICNNTKTSHFYTCHSNLFEGIIPILHQNNIVAYIIMGQMRKNENIPPHLAKYAQTYNLNYDELLASYKSIPICDQKTFTSAMNLIEILISGTQFREFTEYLESNIVENIKYYILLHYTDDNFS
ncbi:MAG: PocR ligand-binding domain-containing protein [Clostridia bacterium]